MINPTTVLRHVRFRLGLSHNVSPLTDDQILELLNQETRYTFSKYYPYFFLADIHESSDKYENMKGIYRIDTGSHEVLGVSRIFRTSQFLYDKYPIYNVDAFNYQIYADLRSMTAIPNTFTFWPPNRMEVFPKFYTPSDYTAELKCVHPLHFMTVPVSLRDQFLELCVLDTRIAIWQIIKNIASLDTAFGTININVDEYQSAADEKRTLLDKWDERFYMEPNRKKIFIC